MSKHNVKTYSSLPFTPNLVSAHRAVHDSTYYCNIYTYSQAYKRIMIFIKNELTKKTFLFTILFVKINEVKLYFR